MLSIKVPKNKLYKTYLEWINPLIHLSKGEIDVLSTLLQLQLAHKHYSKKVLNELLFSDDTKEAIRKRLKVNKRLFNKIYKSLEDKSFITNGQLHPSICKYPVDNRLKLFISIECTK